MDDPDNRTWCPSAPADRPEAVVLGVHADSDGLSYLAEPVPAADALDLVPDGIEPTHVLRFAAFCDQACMHRRGNDCELASKVVVLPTISLHALPRCHLRPRCQWWKQSGADACRQCPLVRTTAPEADADELTKQIADPTLNLDDLRLG